MYSCEYCEISKNTYIVGPYYAGTKWRYLSWYGVKRAGVTFVFDSLTVNIWKITAIRTGVEGASVLRANTVFWRTYSYGCFWNDFSKWLFRTFFLESRFQNHSKWYYENTSRFQTRASNKIWRICLII